MEKRYEIWKRYESMKALLKMHKCPEIIASASADDFANILELLYTF